MLKLVDTATSFYGSGNAPTHKLFKLTSGAYAGRQVMVYSQSPTAIKFAYADPPYTSWSEPVEIAADAADYPASGWMNGEGDVYVAYTKGSSLNLAYRRLELNAGLWQVGDEVVVYNDKANYFPSLVHDSSGKLHICWTCYDSTTSEYRIRYKYSTDNGATWGNGPDDSGEALNDACSGCYAALAILNLRLYCVFSEGGEKLTYRSKLASAALWNAAVDLYDGSGLSDALSVAVSQSGGLLAVTFNADGKLWFLEYDEQNWSSPYLVASDPATAPLLYFNGAIPVVIYGMAIGDAQIEVKYRSKSGTGFAAESPLHSQVSRFDCVLLYDYDGPPIWQNLTEEAGNDTSADLYHPVSGKLLQAVGDGVYLGLQEKFCTLNIRLSTAGDSGATVVWSYFNGVEWQEFTPESGAFVFDQASTLVRLWPDTNLTPADWQKHEIEGKTLYWIRAEVTSAFSSAPVGSQLTPLVDLSQVNR